MRTVVQVFPAFDSPNRLICRAPNSCYHRKDTHSFSRRAENLFEEQLYSQVFPTSDPLYYLCRYCTLAAVTYSARGYPERAYAKWVVLHFVWSRLAPMLRPRQAGEGFHQAWFRLRDSVARLTAVVDIVFNAALHFYRSRRGKGAKAMDVSSFFKRKNRHMEFEKFWRGSANKRRASFRRAWNRYVEAFKAEIEA